MKYDWIKQHETEFSVKSMCQHMSVSRSAYYDWRVRPQIAIEEDDIELIEIIKPLLRIPVQSDHPFQANAATHSVLNQPLIPVNAATLW